MTIYQISKRRKNSRREKKKRRRRPRKDTCAKTVNSKSSRIMTASKHSNSSWLPKERKPLLCASSFWRTPTECKELPVTLLSRK